MFSPNRLFALVLVLASLASCCPDDEGSGGLSVSNAGSLKLNPSDVITVQAGEVGVGATQSVQIELTNVGQGDVTVTSVELIYAAPEGGDPEGAAFTLNTLETPLVIRPFDTVDATEEERRQFITVVYRRQEAFQSRTATVLVRAENNIDGSEFSVAITEQAPNAVAQVTPTVLDFGTVNEGTSAEKTISVANTGTTTLICDGFVITGHPDFSVVFGETG